MDWRYQCLGRWVGAAQVISHFREEEKEGREKEACVCGRGVRRGEGD